MRIFKPQTLVAALVAGVAGVLLLPASPASAMNPCDSDNPPDYCYDIGTTAPAPLAPSNLVLTSVLQNTVTLQWTDNSTNETNWKIRRDQIVSNAWVTTYFQPTTWTGGTTGTVSWTDTGVNANTYVRYYVTAMNADPNYDYPSSSSTLGPANGQTKPKPANPVLAQSTTLYDETSTSIWLHGQAYDWDTTGAIQVLVWHDGVALSPLTANGYVSGFNSTNPGYGDYHGYSTTVTKSTVKGTHTVCLQPVDVGGGTTPAQSCRSYTVYGKPSAATNVAVTVGASTVTVTFKDNADDETGWYLQRSTDGQVSWYAVGNQYPAISGTGGTGSAVDYSTPASGTCYRILMVNSYGQTPSAAACTP
jgi:hypothetical protein